MTLEINMPRCHYCGNAVIGLHVCTTANETGPDHHAACRAALTTAEARSSRLGEQRIAAVRDKVLARMRAKAAEARAERLAAALQGVRQDVLDLRPQVASGVTLPGNAREIDMVVADIDAALAEAARMQGPLSEAHSAVTGASETKEGSRRG